MLTISNEEEYSKAMSLRDNLMFFDEGTTRSWFKVFFEIESSVFVGECKVGNQLDWENGFGGWDVTFFVTFYSIFEIICAARIWFTIGTFENVDAVHGERIPPSRPTIADFVRRSSLRRAKAEAVGLEPTTPFGASLANSCHTTRRHLQ